jgi:DNA-directed RNA polymerase subunit RPC12/RpoP
MVQHIDCGHLYIRKGDDPETYYCLKSGRFLELDCIDEEINCPGHTALYKQNE